jgi:DEAD/DEAH box helicase domain-containing protein
MNKNQLSQDGQSLQADISLASHNLLECITGAGYAVTGRHHLPARDARCAPVPEGLHPTVSERLRALHPGGLYRHQARALGVHLEGGDVCLSTGTASGKSLAFMAATAHTLLSNPSARVLVLYPAKALIQDQLIHWERFLAPLDIRLAFIDGSVPVRQRKEMLMRRRLVLMTPDVVHAWFMGHLADPTVRKFRESLGLVVLDEAHVYDGVFGTNMAFLLRRLQAVSGRFQILSSTATLGDASGFMHQLTGRDHWIVGPEDDGARRPGKEILLVRRARPDGADGAPELLRRLARQGGSRFIAFGDSRRQVELVTAVARRREADPEPEGEEIALELSDGILPYRAGYENEDRTRIQQAFTEGTLRGVVATSALEMGIDIGEVDLVVLLDTPASMKSLWQRIGRAGRRNPGACIWIDGRSVVTDGDEGLAEYLSRPVEPNWLYLENRYAQFGNALCAASEIKQVDGALDRSQFAHLPGEFLALLENELEPTAPVDPDLYPMKQSAQDDPRHAFPLRNGIERNFKIQTQRGEPRGEINFPQALREAYPGAVYYYMATPHRVLRVNHREGQILVQRERPVTTKPSLYTMTFPDFGSGLLSLERFPDGFLAETTLQVSERVTGFREKRGSAETTHVYGPGSTYSQQPMTRFIQTTGVCWSFGTAAAMSDRVAHAILSAFAGLQGIQPRDLGVGRFSSASGPAGQGPVSGVCIFDNANGSLRLTERLPRTFREVVASALHAARHQGDADLVQALLLLEQETEEGSVVPSDGRPQAGGDAEVGGDGEWTRIFAAGSSAMHLTDAGASEVTVREVIYTPAGLQYLLDHPTATVRWMVGADRLQPIHGVSVFNLYNMMTGERRQAA